MDPRAHYGGSPATLKFCSSNAPDTLYYSLWCSDKWEASLLLLIIPISALTMAEEIKYAHEWVIDPN